VQAVNSTIQTFQTAIGPAVGTFDSVSDVVGDITSTIEGQNLGLHEHLYRRPLLPVARSSQHLHLPCCAAQVFWRR